MLGLSACTGKGTGGTRSQDARSPGWGERLFKSLVLET